MEDEVFELANYLKTLVPPGVSNGLALKAFALLLAEVTHTFNSDDVEESAEGIFKAYLGLLKQGKIQVDNGKQNQD